MYKPTKKQKICSHFFPTYNYVILKQPTASFLYNPSHFLQNTCANVFRRATKEFIFIISTCFVGRKNIYVCLFCLCKKPCGGSSELLFMLLLSYTVCYNFSLKKQGKDHGNIFFPWLLPTDIYYEPWSMCLF